jgi:hypothetical protein
LVEQREVVGDAHKWTTVAREDNDRTLAKDGVDRSTLETELA